MKTTTAAGKPAAGTLHASASQLILLIAVGDLAMAFWRAEVSAVNAKDADIRDLQRFEAEFGAIGSRIKPGDPAHLPAVEFTADRYAALQAARRNLYAQKAKLKRACVALARANAMAVSGGNHADA